MKINLTKSGSTCQVDGCNNGSIALCEREIKLYLCEKHFKKAINKYLLKSDRDIILTKLEKFKKLDSKCWDCQELYLHGGTNEYKCKKLGECND